MRTISHLSDLHFGRIHRPRLEPLVHRLQEISPDLVAISGDLTQRAYVYEFKEASRFIASLPGPKIIVPGNHDIPLYNLALRFFFPLSRYRKYITRDLTPMYVDDEIAILGANTTRSLVAKGGRINIGQVENVCRHFLSLGKRQTRILVTHHPFDLPEGRSTFHLVGRSRMAMENFARCGVDLFLSGHLHTAGTGNTSRYMIEGFSALVVRAGTVISSRERGELNSFNLVRIEAQRISIETHAWQSERRTFAPSQKTLFHETAEGWVRE